MSRLYDAARPALFKLDPERAHRLSILALKTRTLAPRNLNIDPRLRVKIGDLTFPNPVGLAAGYDKNAEVPDALLRLGFGFVEVGTVTPLPQEGNPKPRVFRVPERGAIINRLGFNNDGQADVAARLEKRKRRAGLVGVNIGANKDAKDRVDDYVSGIHRFESMAAYLTVNISSPNTPGLRKLQGGEDLDRLLESVMAAREGAAAIQASRPCPVFLKVAPDLTRADIGHIADMVLLHKLDGLIVANTTVTRNGVTASDHAAQAGGLSGRPLMALSTYVLASFRRALGPNMPLIGAGGIASAEDAIAKIEAGADLVQLYTALVYGGPTLPKHIVNGLSHYLDRTGLETLRAIRDTRVDAILEAPPPPSFAQDAA